MDRSVWFAQIAGGPIWPTRGMRGRIQLNLINCENDRIVIL